MLVFPTELTIPVNVLLKCTLTKDHTNPKEFLILLSAASSHTLFMIKFQYCYILFSWTSGFSSHKVQNSPGLEI